MIHIFIGTKAQVIKMAPLMLELKNRSIPYNFIHSGQHHETISDILADFDLPEPDFHIGLKEDVIKKIQVPKWVLACEKATRKKSPVWRGHLSKRDIVLVHGDTLSALLGALAAKRVGVPCAHIESGLRSGNFFHPFPEELVRVATFRLASMLFCPDEKSVSNVARLGKATINTCGNTLIDATRHSIAVNGAVRPDQFGVVSIHRYENIFDREQFEWIINQLEIIAADHRLAFIMHPPTEHRLRECGFYERLKKHPNIELHQRYSYTRFVGLLSSARFLITDGGSNQEECSYLGVPCLVMRKATEREEGLGQNAVLSAYDPQVIARFFENIEHYRRPVQIPDSSPCKIIVDALKDFY